jgi:hypothetical protein
MEQANDAPAMRVPGPFGRAMGGIVVREGRFYWSGFAQFWRLTATFFVVSLVMRLLFPQPYLQAEPGMFGIPWLKGLAVVVSLAICLITYRQRRRFNAAALPAEGAG